MVNRQRWDPVTPTGVYLYHSCSEVTNDAGTIHNESYVSSGCDHYSGHHLEQLWNSKKNRISAVKEGVVGHLSHPHRDLTIRFLGGNYAVEFDFFLRCQFGVQENEQSTLALTSCKNWCEEDDSACVGRTRKMDVFKWKGYDQIKKHEN
ncbi:hypothetical protein Tco_1256171 [Tanacetum coccineum]